jgi:ribosomal protein S18 acetylase RimI-like enzyme
MGGYRPTDGRGVEILRVRIHPALRRIGLGRAVMAELERRAAASGCATARLDTATNQPEALAFYRALGYVECGTETRHEWSWTLVYFSKQLSP